jgi:hypothetical protein
MSGAPPKVGGTPPYDANRGHAVAPAKDFHSNGLPYPPCLPVPHPAWSVGVSSKGNKGGDETPCQRMDGVVAAVNLCSRSHGQLCRFQGLPFLSCPARPGLALSYVSVLPVLDSRHSAISSRFSMMGPI